MELVSLNDVFFNKFTSQMLDEKAGDIIEKINDSKLDDKYTISSKFNGTVLNTDKLPTGCKTVLNIIYYPDKIFDICEYGDIALDGQNQYIIIGRNPTCLLLEMDEIFELKSRKIGDKTLFTLKKSF